MRLALDGALVIDKPEGPTSHDVVAAVRRITGERRVGHTGTLDPMATGVLPLLLGRATRLAQFLGSDRKRYDARVRFGVTTDTGDATGEPAGHARATELEPAALEAALARFRGPQLQTPPAFSAKKIGGRRAYALARRDAAPALAPVSVTVFELSLEGLESDVATLRMETSAGFYVRSLARDLGEALGVGAHLCGLRRTASGPFDLSTAVSLDRLAAEGPGSVLVPMERLAAHLPSVLLSDREVERVAHGATVAAPSEVVDAPAVRLFGPSGRLVGVARAEPGRSGVLRPTVVLM